MSRIVFHILSLASFCLFPLLSCGQYVYTHYDTKDGLAGSTVHGMLQDRKGFIWFCTEGGLSRFDGTHFRNYTAADGLPSNEMLLPFEDRKGRIWFTSFSNAICYYADGKLHNQENDSLLKKIRLTSIVHVIGESEAGEIILEGYDEYYSISMEGRLIQTGPAELMAGPEAFKKHFRISKGRGASNGQARLRSGTFDKSKLMEVLCTGTKGWNAPFRIFLSHEYYWVLGKNNHSPERLFSSREVERIELFEDSLLILRKKNAPGVYLFDLNKRTIIASYLPGVVVHSLFRDKEGNLWFSTKGNGVFKLPPLAALEYAFTARQGAGVITSIQKDTDTLYVGTDDYRFWKLLPVGVQSLPYRLFPYRVSRMLPPGKYAPPVFDFTMIRHYSGLLPFSVTAPVTLCKTSFRLGDTLLVSLISGAVLVHIPSNRVLYPFLYNGRSTCAWKKRDSFYIGTPNGLYLKTGNKQASNLGQHFPVLQNRINFLAEDGRGMLWVATGADGMIGCRGGRVEVVIGAEHGLASNNCFCAYAAGDAVWVGTDKGLSKIMLTPDGYKVRYTLRMADGLGADVINAIYADGHEVYMATQQGLNFFDERKIPAKGICNIQMEQISVADTPVSLPAGTLTLAAGGGNIRFEFVGISLLAAGEMLYHYRLEGLDSNWRSTREGSVSYNALPSGSYRFSVFAVNRLGNRSPVLVQRFVVEKKWHEYAWIQLGMLLLFIALIALAVWIIIRSIKKSERKKRDFSRKVAHLEQMALRAQMNPHFIFNCLNAIQQYILKHDEDGAEQYLKAFAGLIRKTLEHAPRLYISLGEEIAYLEHYIELERMQSGDSFQYTLKVAEGLALSLPVPNMIIQPYVENAIKHGLFHRETNRRLHVGFRKSANGSQLECVVEDNGPGIAYTLNLKQRMQAGRHSVGMSVTRKRLDMLNHIMGFGEQVSLEITDLTDQNNMPAGTRVIIRFPLPHS